MWHYYRWSQWSFNVLAVCFLHAIASPYLTKPIPRTHLFAISLAPGPCYLFPIPWHPYLSLSPLLHGSPFLALSYGGITQPTPDTIDLDCRVNHKGAALKASVPRDKMGRGEDKKSSWVARGTIRRGERATSRHALLPSFFIAARPSNDLDDLCLSSHCLGLTMALNSLSLWDKDIRVLILDTRSDPTCQCV